MAWATAESRALLHVHFGASEHALYTPRVQELLRQLSNGGSNMREWQAVLSRNRKKKMAERGVVGSAQNSTVTSPARRKPWFSDRNLGTFWSHVYWHCDIGPTVRVEGFDGVFAGSVMNARAAL